jgi:hypothetical protein
MLAVAAVVLMVWGDVVSESSVNTDGGRRHRGGKREGDYPVLVAPPGTSNGSTRHAWGRRHPQS